MRILAIDTATEACSAALWNDGTLSAHFEICPREHTQRILPLVQEVLTESGTTLSELDALAFGRGPGSFTNVRIGIGIAQGLALGAELPMIGVSTLATMAQGAWRKTGATRVLAAIDAGADRFDASLGGLGGCPYALGASGNVCSEEIVHALQLMGYDTGVDLTRLVAAAQRLPALIGRDIPSQIVKAGQRLTLHPVPADFEAIRERALAR